MSWTHVGKNPGMGLEEQWIFRPGVAPLCSLKKDVHGMWGASLLNLTGISTTHLDISGQWSLEQVKGICEVTLREMGHKWTDAPRKHVGKKKEVTKWLGNRSWS